VGIDPNGGANPYDSDVVWSDWGGNQLASAGFRELSVVATAQGPRVTLFLFTTQRFPSQQNGIFWDDAALTVLQPGTGQPPPADDPDPDPPPQNPDPQPTSPPPTQVVVTPQAPNPDGSIIHQVARGETLSSIARAYGRTLEEVLALNPELGDGQLIRVGQLIVIEPRPGATPATFTPMPTDDPGTTEVAVADPQTASVCMQLYEDRNANGLRDPSEPPLGGGSLRLDAEDGTQVGSTMTDGGADPVCFDGLPPGMYMARGEPPAGYGLPSGSVRRLDLSSGGTLTLAFGAVQGADLALPTPPPETTLVEVEDGGTNQALQNIGLLIFGLAGVTLVIGLGITFMLRRRYMLLLIVATIGLSPLQAQTDGGSFCVRGFEDLNADGTRNPDESLLQRNFAANLQDADGVVIASRTIEDSDRRSTGVVCFDDLPAGQYGVVVTSAVYRPTGPDSMLASITPDGMPVVLEYGAQRIDSGIDPALVADDADTTPQFERLMIAFIGGLAAAVGVAALGIVLYVLVMRPRRPVTPEPDPEARFRPPDPYDDYQEYR
jgi:LysM repeat protein